jgi:hypothetical protein
MAVLNSIRQLLRTPAKTLFFFLLLICTIAFFVLGYSLWRIAESNIDKINRSFTTIGTVQQKPTSLATGSTWNAYTKSYSYHSGPVYGSPIPISVLDFPGANYIQKPEKRPVFYAYDPSYVIDEYAGFEMGFNAYNLILEMQPVADCVPSEPVLVRVKKVLWGSLTGSLGEIWFCDSGNDKPEPLYANKTYIVSLTTDLLYDISVGFDKTVYAPSRGIAGYQFTKDGKPVRDGDTITTSWDEVTDNFFETPRGKRWQALVESFARQKHMITVVPTNGTKLVMPFFEGNARINEGRDISAEEYRSGDKVCLISRYFARNNGLAVGDSMGLPLYYADYYSSPAYMWLPISLINARGESYSAFEDGAYRIIGIYDAVPMSSMSDYNLGENTVVIPMASVRHSDEDNIVAMGPMMGYSTSFQIPNGQIDQYMAAWNARGIADLDIRFYDKGYTKIMAGLETMRNTAVVLFAVGAVTTLFVLILFCHLFIAKQRKRTAIERSLGMSKRLCAASMLAGLLLVVLAAYAVGSAAGYGLAGLTAAGMDFSRGRAAFDTAFSDWANSSDANAISDVAVSTEGAARGALAAAAVIPAALLIATLNIRGNLKSEPLKMLGEKER